jgi:hypothetical protein
MGAKNQQKPISGALNVLTYPVERYRPLQKSIGPALAATLGRGSVHALGWHVSIRSQAHKETPYALNQTHSKCPEVPSK